MPSNLLLDADATGWLLEAGWISVEDIVEGRLELASTVRRNRVLKVSGAGGGGVFFKGCDPARRGTRRTLAIEARFLRACRGAGPLASLAGEVPELLAYDPEAGLLASELVAEAVPLAEAIAGGEPERRWAIGCALGRALSRVHRVFSDAGPEAEAPDWLPRGPAWALSIHRPDEGVFREASPARLQLLRIVQREAALIRGLDALRRRWRDSALIHGDLRSSNVLVRGGADGARPEVRLVDWELVRWGDPAWDLGGALQEVLRLWIERLPPCEDLAQIAAIDAASELPWAELRGVLGGLWEAYAAGGWSRSEAEALLERGVPLSAARLLQTVWEGARGSERLSAPAVLMVQVAANVLTDPRAAAGELYRLG